MASRGTARSTIRIGRPRRARSTGARASWVRTTPAELVEETTTSASSSAAGSASSAAARARAASARRAARSSVRFATTSIVAPRERRFRAVDSLVRPAPTSTTRRRSSPSNTCSASAAAAAGIDAGLSPIAVSTRARRPARRAMRNVRPSRGPGEPASNASLTWPRISPSPGTIESRPAATRKRWSAADSSASRYAAGASAGAPEPASSSSARSAWLPMPSASPAT